MTTADSSYTSTDGFVRRHIGIRAEDEARMLSEVGYASIDDLIDAAVPANIRATSLSDLLPAATEAEAASELGALADRNTIGVPMIGLGYHGTITPSGHQAEYPRRPGLVYRLHALSG
jgi:glycine dehydrogenase